VKRVSGGERVKRMSAGEIEESEWRGVSEEE